MLWLIPVATVVLIAATVTLFYLRWYRTGFTTLLVAAVGVLVSLSLITT